jgi:regulator of sigma E protease
METIKMIFSPSTGAYKQVGGFKAIFDIFRVHGAGKHSGESLLYYQLCLGDELITYSSTDGGHVMFCYTKSYLVKNHLTNF